MKAWICPRCDKLGIQAEGYRYCTKCRNARQKKARALKASPKGEVEANRGRTAEIVATLSDDKKEKI